MKKFFAVLFLAIIAGAAFFVLYQLGLGPGTFDGVAKFIVEDTIPKTHALNSVTAVVFDFRGYDTLGEAFVLYTAVTGVAVILRKTYKGGRGNETK